MDDYDVWKQYEKLTLEYRTKIKTVEMYSFLCEYEHARKCLREVISLLRKSASSGEEEYYFLPRCDKSDVKSWCDATSFYIEDIPVDGE